MKPSEPDPFDTVSQGPPRFVPAGPDDLTLSQNSLTPLLSKVHIGQTTQSAPPGYTISGELGRGGMGVVYSATDTRLKRAVALKMLLSGLDGPHLIRFLIEAESMAQVRHPNVVHVFEAGEHLGRPFLALEYLPGGTLSARLKDKPQYSTREAVELMVKISRGVEAAHRQGIVHRDLKPGNVMFDASDEPRVTDFGLAKRGDQDLTATESTMGTPAYMAPEQALGKTKSAGPSADVYSLGVMLFELLTGQRPFNGDNPASLIYKVIHEPAPTIKSINAGLPRDLDVIIDKCLEKDPRRRYADAGLLADDLECYLRDEPISARPAGSLERAFKWTRRHPAIALIGSTIAISVLVIGIGGSMLLRRTDEARKVALLALDDTTKARSELQAQLDEASEILDTNSVVQIQEVFKNGASPSKCLELLRKIPEKHRNIEWGLTAKSLDASLFRLYGHTGPITAVAISKDGSLVVTAATDGSVRIWESGTGNNLRVISENPGKITHIAISANNQRIVTANDQNSITVWDSRTGEKIASRRDHESPVIGVAITAEGTAIVSGSAKHGIRIWQIGSDQSVVAFSETNSILTSLAANENAARIAVGDATGVIRVYDGKTQKLLREIAAELPSPVALAMASDGNRLIACPIQVGKTNKVVEAETARVWDLETFKEITRLREPREKFSSVSISADGKRALTGSGNSARIWNLQTGDSLAKLRGHNSDVSAVAISATGNFALTGSADNTARVWEGNGEQARPELREHRNAINSVAISKDGRRILTGSDDHTARVWDADTFRTIHKLVGHSDAVNSVAISFDGERFVTGSEDKTVRVWDAQTGKCLKVLEHHQGIVHDVALSPDGHRVLIANGDNSAGIYEVDTGKALLDLVGHEDSVTCVAYSAQGDRIVTGSADRTVRIWDATSGKLMHTMRGHRGDVSCVAISANGGWIVSGSNGLNKEADNTVRVWDAHTGEQKFEIRGHAGTVSDVAISRDGKRIIIASDDKTARVLDSRTGQALFILRGHTLGVTSVAISSDGFRLVTGSQDKTANVWDARPLSDPNEPFKHNAHVTDVFVSADGTTILTGSEDGTIRMWNSVNGELIRVFQAFKTAITDVRFANENSRIVARNLDGTIRAWKSEDLSETSVEPSMKFPAPSRWTADKHFFLVPDGTKLSFVPSAMLSIDEPEQTRRRTMTRR